MDAPTHINIAQCHAHTRVTRIYVTHTRVHVLPCGNAPPRQHAVNKHLFDSFLII